MQIEFLFLYKAMIISTKLKNQQKVTWLLNDFKNTFSKFMASLKNELRNVK